MDWWVHVSNQLKTLQKWKAVRSTAKTALRIATGSNVNAREMYPASGRAGTIWLCLLTHLPPPTGKEKRRRDSYLHRSRAAWLCKQQQEWLWLSFCTRVYSHVRWYVRAVAFSSFARFLASTNIRHLRFFFLNWRSASAHKFHFCF